jgi:hypothetical protein
MRNAENVVGRVERARGIFTAEALRKAKSSRLKAKVEGEASEAGQLAGGRSMYAPSLEELYHQDHQAHQGKLEARRSTKARG